jgi:hypothetical protein
MEGSVKGEEPVAKPRLRRVHLSKARNSLETTRTGREGGGKMTFNYP